MNDYRDYLASRNYRRIIVERTVKSPGDLILHGRSVERVPESAPRVVAIKRKGVGA